MIIAMLLFGCPEPVDFTDRTVDNSTVQAAKDEAPIFQAGNQGPAGGQGSGQAGAGSTMPTDANLSNSGGAPPSMGTFAADLPESEVQPRFTQEELKDGAVIRGTANCPDCTGQLLVRALPPPPEDPNMGMGEGMQLITQVVIKAAGNFSLNVPADAPVVLQVVDDANSDGIPSQGERMGMREEGAVFASGVVENVSLMVGVFPKKDPIEGLGVIPTPPLPDEEGEGAMPADMIATPTGVPNAGTPNAAPPNTPGGQSPAPDQVMPLGEQQPQNTNDAQTDGPPSDE